VADDAADHPDHATPEIAALLDGAMLPPCPLSIDPDDEVVVAVWHRDDLGAVMTIWRDPDGDLAIRTPDYEGWPYNVDITQYQLVDGQWYWTGGGGSDWPVPYGERASYPQPFLTGFAFGSATKSEEMLWTGIAPLGVGRVRAEMGNNVQEVLVEPVTGAFMVAFPYPGPEPNGLRSI
jgi:hypothetical protein